MPPRCCWWCSEFVIGIHGFATRTPDIAQQESGALIRAALLSDPGYQRQREELLRALPGKARAPAAGIAAARQGQPAGRADSHEHLEAELGRDSSNALLQELLISTCQEEMRVLTAVGDADGPNQEI